MKVFFYSSYITIDRDKEFSKNITGYGYMVRDIATSVAAHGVHVDLLTQACITKGKKYKNINILPRKWINIFFNFKIIYLFNGLSSAIKEKANCFKTIKILFYYISLGYVEKIIENNNYDLIHIHGFTYFTNPLISICTKHNVKYLVTLHGLNSFTESVKLSKKELVLEFDFYKKIVSENLPLTVISTTAKKQILEYCNVQNSENIYIIPNGCSSLKTTHKSKMSIREKFKIGDDRKIMLCVGNLSERKNQIQIVNAYNLLSNEDKNRFVILFLGTDVTEGLVLKEIENNYLQNSLIICGNISRNEIGAYYSQADFTILASVSEGFGLSIIEGFTFGLPNLTFNDLDAVPDIHNEKSMILVETRDDISLAKGMVNILNTKWDNVFIKRYSSNFALEYMGEKYINIYKKLNKKNMLINDY